MSLFQRLGYVTGYITRSRAATKGKSMGNNQSQRIASAVKDYVQMHIDREFTAKELRSFVLARVDNSAPGSADRIMRQLRQAGAINYVLVSRSKSLYKGVKTGLLLQEAAVLDVAAGCGEGQ
jgi:hypothetical protein